jgi:acetoin utilization protein AcuB
MRESKRTVADWMTANPFTIHDDATVIEAMHVMKDRGVRRLPVLNNGRLCGVVTDRMIKDYSPGKATTLDTWEVHYLLSKTSVRDVMNPQPHTVSPDADLTTAATSIRDHRLYGLCVVNDAGDLVGVLTIKDLLDAFLDLSETTDRVAAATA